MSWRVAILPNAEADLREAHSWYEDQRPGLGDELLIEVRPSVHQLEKDPGRNPVYYRGFRRTFTHRIPYKLFYRIEDNCVIVFRILHPKREHHWQLKA